MLIRLAIRNLLRNPRRTAAVLLTIAMGTSSLFLFHGFNAGIMNLKISVEVEQSGGNSSRLRV